MVEKLNSNPAELQDLCEEAEYYSLSSLHKHLISGSKRNDHDTTTSYPRFVKLSYPASVDVESVRLLMDAGFELKSGQHEGGQETLYFTSSKSLNQSTVNWLAREVKCICRFS